MLHITFNPEPARETRTPVRIPDQPSGGLFPGWGPKF